MRREAIDKMFEGRDSRPTGPKVAHKIFDLDFEWSTEEPELEEGSLLRVQYKAQVHTSEPRKMKVMAVAALREVGQGIELLVTHEGPQAKFVLGTAGVRFSKWQDDDETMRVLENIMVRGLSARGLLAGADLMAESSENSKDPGDEARDKETH